VPAADDSAALLGEIIQQCVREGMPVDIEGLGTFLRTADGNIEFVPCSRPRVFLAYVNEDSARVGRLYEDLSAAGLDPWLDKRKLLPGQDWPRCIERAIDTADFFVACFSHRALRKRGQFQRELRHALEQAGQMPLDDVYVIPVRLEDCEVPKRLRTQYQCLDLFPDWKTGTDQLIRSINEEMKTRQSRP
jgi:TIR domain